MFSLYFSEVNMFSNNIKEPILARLLIISKNPYYTMVYVNNKHLLGLIMAVLCLLLFFPSQSIASEQKRVVFDQSKAQLYSPFDSGFSGMSLLCSLLKKSGYTVSLNSMPLNDRIPKLASSDTIILGLFINSSYSEHELKHLDQFLVKGGTLIVLGEHDNLFNNNHIQNKLLNPYGMSFSSLPKHTTKDLWPFIKPNNDKLSKIRMYYPCNIQCKNAVVLCHLKSDNKSFPVCATKQVGSGKIIALADAELLWNMDQRHGINEVGNFSFLKSLLPKTTKPDHHKKTPQLKKATSSKYAFIPTEGFACSFTDNLSGYSSLLNSIANQGYSIHHHFDAKIKPDLAVYILPLGTQPYKFNKAKKTIFISDAQSHIPRASSMHEGLLKAKLKIKENLYFENLTSQHGFIFSKTTLANKDFDNFLTQAKFTKTQSEFPIIRANHIQHLPFSKNKRVILATEKVSMNDYNNFIPNFIEGSGANKINFSQNKTSQNTLRVLISYSQSDFSIADAELLNDSTIHTKHSNFLLMKILEWMK